MAATGSKSAEEQAAENFERWFEDVTLVTAVTSRPDVVIALNGEEFQAFQEASERLLAKAGVDLKEIQQRNSLILPEEN